MINEDYVGFETAKLLKEKGFKSDDCHTAYDENGQFFWYGDYSKDRKGVVDAPTLQMAMKWLRETYKIHFCLEPELYQGRIIYDVRIDKQAKNHKFLFDGELEVIDYQESNNLTYEQACEAAIKYCLENLI